MRRRGRPSLLGTVARTAVVASTAQAAAGRVHHKQQQRHAQAAPPAAAPAAAPPPPPPAPPAASAIDGQLAQLQQLGSLRDQGILTDAEFEAKKALILGT